MTAGQKAMNLEMRDRVLAMSVGDVVVEFSATEERPGARYWIYVLHAAQNAVLTARRRHPERRYKLVGPTVGVTSDWPGRKAGHVRIERIADRVVYPRASWWGHGHPMKLIEREAHGIDKAVMRVRSLGFTVTQ